MQEELQLQAAVEKLQDHHLLQQAAPVLNLPKAEEEAQAVSETPDQATRMADPVLTLSENPISVLI